MAATVIDALRRFLPAHLREHRHATGTSMPATRAASANSTSTAATTDPVLSAVRTPPPSGWNASSANALAHPILW